MLQEEAHINDLKIKYVFRHFTTGNLDVSQKSKIETSMEVEFEEAKSVAQLWKALINYDAAYTNLHPIDY